MCSSLPNAAGTDSPAELDECRLACPVSEDCCPSWAAGAGKSAGFLAPFGTLAAPLVLLLLGTATGCRSTSTPAGQPPAVVRMIPGVGKWAEQRALRQAAEADPFPTAEEAGL